MQIVITDGYTLNPGDLSWEVFKQLGDIVYYDRTPADKTMERCRNATVIITNKTPITSQVIAAAAQLKVIAVIATGYNVVDTVAAKERNIPVCNVPVYGTNTVAQHTFALLLELANHVGKHAQSVIDGDWIRSADWSYTKTPVIELSGKVLGIIGFGRIGQQTANIARAFGMQVIYYDRLNKRAVEDAVSLKELLDKSDFISLHCLLTADNNSMINSEFLSAMKPTAFLINTSRGQLINENDLADALKNHVIAGAALDVLSAEPPAGDNPLIGLTNCIITPHNAWTSFEARQRIMQTTFNNVKNALAGDPQNVVNR